MRLFDGRQHASSNSVTCLVCVFGVCDLAGDALITVREFSAYTECPQCDVVACHYLREAERKPRREDYETESEYLLAYMMASGPLFSLGYIGPPSSYRQWRSEVVRTCVACQHQWCEGERTP